MNFCRLATQEANHTSSCRKHKCSYFTNTTVQELEAQEGSWVTFIHSKEFTEKFKWDSHKLHLPRGTDNGMQGRTLSTQNARY